MRGNYPRYDDAETSIVSFVDLSSSAKNINSSVLVTLDSTSSSNNDTETVSSNNDTETVSSKTVSNDDIIKKLLEEIQKLKNQIENLEKTSDSSIQKNRLYTNP